MKQIKLSPSVFAADITNLKEQLGAMEASGVDYLHVDVMDGHFVERIAFGADHVRMLKQFTKVPLDVHLMVAQPEHHLDAILDAGADIVTIHKESTTRLNQCLQLIRRAGRKSGVVLCPAANPAEVEYALELSDMVLVMTVNPGAGSQKFMPDMLGKIRLLRELIGERAIDLEVDGSIDDRTAKLCLEAGANVFVSGGYVFGGNVGERLGALKAALGIA